MTTQLRTRVVAGVVVLIAVTAPAARATGGDESMEDAALEAQPARTLAQQALAILEIRNDPEEARMRIDAALDSDDRDDVDLPLLAAADEALDAGGTDDAVDLLNRALGGGPAPVDEERAALSAGALHNAGRAFEPNSTSQELVAALAGALLIAGAGWLGWWRRARGR